MRLAERNDAPLLTAEQFGRLSDDGLPSELVAGKIVDRAFGSMAYGSVCTKVICLLSKAEECFGTGTAVAGIGVITTRQPDTVRGVDAAYFRSERVPADELGDEYLDMPPNVVFEVLDRLGKRVNRTSVVQEYLAASVETVCLVDHLSRTVLVWDTNRQSSEMLYRYNDNLPLPAIHPRLRAPVSDFFN